MQLRMSAFIAVFVLALSVGSQAQGIIVTVDGDPVRFSGAGPQTVSGRVLVPLRGVLEKMGAFVGWDAPTQTVVAERGDTSVQLRIGSRTATINGTPTSLDVPAVVYAGSTMVPLRFLGEALGANILWDAGTRAVIINTDGNPPSNTRDNPPAQSGSLEITGFTHSASGWLNADDVLEVELTGTPGATAMFQVPGIVSNVQLREVSSGRYTGTWKVPASGSKLAISGASLIGQLRRGNQERMIQAGSPISVDTDAPVISNPMPAAATTAATERPSISATFDDKTGSGIDVDSVRITVNGADRTAAASVTTNFVNYRPDEAMKAGQHSVMVTVRDNAGNQTSSSWKFAVTDAGSIITSVTVAGDDDAAPGDVVTVRAEGKPGSTATFAIGKAPTGIAMREASPGVYTGEYTVRRGDNLAGEPVVVSLRTTSGNVFHMEATRPFGGTAKAPDAPTIKVPAAGESAKSPLVVTGTAPAGSRVRIRVEYTTQLLGVLGTTGVLSDQQVEATSKGFYESQPINLSGFLKGKNTQYTITVTSVSATGVESEPATVTVEG